MSLTSYLDNLQITDYTDGFYSASQNYVDLAVNIPPAGCNDDVSWTVDVDGTQIDSGGFHLEFSNGPVNYGLRRVYVPTSGKVLTWHWSGGSLGTDDFSIDLLVGQIPIALVRLTYVWQHAIPYVKSGGVWKQAFPFVHTADGWVATTG